MNSASDKLKHEIEKTESKMQTQVSKTGDGNVFFIMGMRRSGTSILRQLVGASDGVEQVVFEPHNLWRNVMNLHFKRLKSKEDQQAVDDFSALANGKCIGAKFALNPGIDAMDWIWFHKVWPESKFIFIIRNVNDVYLSYLEADKKSVRGAIPWETYSPMYHWQLGCLLHYHDTFPERSCVINYAKLIADPDSEMKKVWTLLDVEPVRGLDKMIKKPRHSSEESRK